MIYLCVKERGVLFGTALIILFASVAALAQAPMEIPSSADRVRTTTSRNPAASLAFDALPYADDLSDFKFDVDVYPSKFFLGDVAYFYIRQTNVSDKPLTILSESHFGSRPYVALTSKASPIRPIYSIGEYYSLAGCVTLQPGESYKVSRRCFTSAISCDADEDDIVSFWNDVRLRVAETGLVDCEFVVYLAPPRSMLEQEKLYKSFNEKVFRPIGGGSFTVVARPRNEIQFLESIRRDKQETPRDTSYRLLSVDQDLSVCLAKGAAMGGCALPETIDGWRRFEEKFSPSTLKDECVLTRLMLTYYTAPEGAETQTALAQILEFVNSRPEAQRLAFFVSLQRIISGSQYDTKNAKLISEARRLKTVLTSAY